MKNAKESAWAVTRRWVNEIHLWLGIASGIIIFLVCLSGTIYTFKEEIQEWLEPERYRIAEIPTNQRRLPLAELISVIGEGTGKEVGSITIPHELNRTYMVNVKAKEEKGRGSNVPVNPYTGEITTSGDPVGGEFFMTMFRLHRWLLLDMEIGRPIVGWATIIFTLIIISGMVIWIPKKVRYWKQGLKIMWSGNWKRINHDLHNSLGFYSAFLLLVMSLTGLYWSFEWYKEGLFKVLGVEQTGGGGGRGPGGGGGPEKEVEKAAIPLLEFEKYMAEGDKQLNYDGNYRLTLPKPGDSEITLFKSKVGFFAPSASDKLVLDKATAQVITVERFRDQALNQRIARSIKSLHIGDVYGTFTKILYFIACLIATTLPVTGTIIWINKLRKKKKKKRSRVAISQ